MQPYFFPYAGYFRLFAAADVFVILDTVQFPRRGWVHRNRLPDRKGEAQWLTVPIAKAAREVLIQDVRLAEGAAGELADDTRRFPLFDAAEVRGHPLVQAMLRPDAALVPYLTRLLEETCQTLGISCAVKKASELADTGDTRAQDRILEIAAGLRATHYVNASGGRELYDAAAFARRGIELRFFDPYQGSDWSILYRLMTEDPSAVAKEIRSQS